MAEPRAKLRRARRRRIATSIWTSWPKLYHNCKRTTCCRWFRSCLTTSQRIHIPRTTSKVSLHRHSGLTFHMLLRFLLTFDSRRRVPRRPVHPSRRRDQNALGLLRQARRHECAGLDADYTDLSNVWPGCTPSSTRRHVDERSMGRGNAVVVSRFGSSTDRLSVFLANEGSGKMRLEPRGSRSSLLWLSSYARPLGLSIATQL